MKKEIKEHGVIIYDGKEGLKKFLAAILKEKKSFLTFGEEGKPKKVLGKDFIEFIKKVEKSKISDKVLAREGVTYHGGKTSEFKILPKKIKSPVSTVVYGNKVAQVIWSKPKAIVVVDKETANSHRTYFEYIWDKAKK